MKKNLLYPALLLLAGSLTLNSCGEDAAGGGSRKGSIRPEVELNSGFLGIDIESRAGETGERGVEDLALTVTSTDGTYSKTWESVTDFDPEEEFPIGTYTVEVACGDPEEEGFGKKAAYYDSQDIKVFENQVTPVSLTAVRTHAMLTIKYTEAFEHYVKTAAIKVVSPQNSSIIFQYNDEDPETRSALLVPGLTKVSMSMQRYNGTWADANIVTFETKAQYHYTVTLDVNQGNLGNPMLQVQIDDNVEEEIVEVDLSEEVVNAPAPEIFLEGINNEETLTIVEGSYVGEPIRASIIAKGDISSVNLNVRSTYLEQSNWKAATESDGVDLIPMDKDEQTIYSNAGLECHGIWNRPGRLAAIDFTKVINGLEYRESDKDKNDNVSTFTLNVTDKNGNTPEAGPATFSVKVLPVDLSLQNPSYLNIGDTEMDLEMAFNGGDPNEKVTFKVKDLNGFVPVEAKCTATQENIYTVHLSGMPTYYNPSNGNKTTIEASFVKNDGNLKVATLEVERHGVVAAVKENNIFATKAYVEFVDFINLETSENLTPKFVYNNKVLESTKYDENIYFVEGLTAGSENVIDISFVDSQIKCTPVSFVTEDALKIEYGDMETWEIIPGQSKYWWQSYLGVPATTPWGTMNLVTTSAGGSSTNMFNHDGCAYVARSGTDRSTDKKSGSYAAVIKTIGWGYSDANGGMNAKNLTVGSLHLGPSPKSKDEVIDYGWSFKSRPKGLKFQYKYVPRNSIDYGYVEFWVKDSKGEIISKAESNLAAKSEYEAFYLPVNYDYNCAKAATICVIFRSSNNPQCQTISNDNLTKPEFGNLSDQCYEGSFLYIDDVEFDY